MTVSIQTADNKTVAASPYHPDLPTRAKAIGGKWNGEAWEFDARDEQRVRALYTEIYGTDGAPSETVTIRWRPGYISEQTIYLFGRQIATRRERDRSVTLGDGVVIIDGRFSASGGSRANPRIDSGDGVVLEIRDIPAGHADLSSNDYQLEIVERGNAKEALEAERTKLMARIAEIDAALAKTPMNNIPTQLTEQVAADWIYLDCVMTGTNSEGVSFRNETTGQEFTISIEPAIDEYGDTVNPRWDGEAQAGDWYVTDDVDAMVYRLVDGELVEVEEK